MKLMSLTVLLMFFMQFHPSCFSPAPQDGGLVFRLLRCHFYAGCILFFSVSFCLSVQWKQIKLLTLCCKAFHRIMTRVKRGLLFVKIIIFVYSMVLETRFFTSTMFIDFYLWCPGKKNIVYRCSCALSLVCLGLVDIFLNVGGK